jgi:hypothetical protein
MVKDIYKRALALPDNDAIIIDYEIFINNKGRMQLTNMIKLLTKKDTDKLKALLRGIEEYSTDMRIIPIHNTKP